jgi:hypothetical protein
MAIISIFQLFGVSEEGIFPCDSGFITEAIFGYSASIMLFPEISGRQQYSRWNVGSRNTKGTVNTSLLCRV